MSESKHISTIIKHLMIGVAVAGICLYYAVRGISWRQTIDGLKEADLRWIVAAIGIYIIGYLLRTVRWQVLLAPIKSIPAKQLFAPLIIGFFANNILPLRMGELVRAHVTGKKFRISRTASLGTILLERLFDTVSFLSTFVAAALFFPFPVMVRRAALLLGIACGTLIAGILLSLRYRDLLHRLIERSPIPSGLKIKVRHLMENFIHGVSSMNRISQVLWALILSLIIWILEGSGLYLLVHAFPISFSYPKAFFLLFFLGLSVTLPQAPGYVGTMELFGVTALTLLGVHREQALPIILTIHVTQFSFIAILGLLALWTEGVSTIESTLTDIYTKSPDTASG
jgi:glycosyltransferase 2 family protein